MSLVVFVYWAPVISLCQILSQKKNTKVLRQQLRSVLQGGNSEPRVVLILVVKWRSLTLKPCILPQCYYSDGLVKTSVNLWICLADILMEKITHYDLMGGSGTFSEDFCGSVLLNVPRCAGPPLSNALWGSLRIFSGFQWCWSDNLEIFNKL